MRTGLFGGTFNPVHTGHIRISEEIKETFGFDRMIIIPSAVPPHKKAVDIADAEHRFEMTRRAFSDKSEYSVSDIEIRRRGPSYTVDTVNHFIANLHTDDEVYLLLGIDAFLEIDTWMSYMKLFELAPMVVMSRPGYGIRDINRPDNGTDDFMGDVMGDFLKKRISADYTFSKNKQYYGHEKLQSVFRSYITPVDISATDIRENIKKGKPIAGLVPETVEKYIMEKGLYQ
jgi:nicotinate-nucleotide adenylyltransferase